MGIFRRGSKDTSAGPFPDIAETDSAEADSADDIDDSPDSPDSAESGRPESAQQAGAGADHAGTTESSRPVSRSRGPFDRSEVDGLEGRLDLGALWLTGTPGMELRIEVEEESQNLVGVTAVLGESAVQLQAFAAPRTEGIWDDIRTEIAASITSQGGTADKTSGPLGFELRAQVPGQGPDGRTVLSPVRFVGVDGPRWFLRAVLSGPAAVDEDAASELLDVVRATVVVRGDEAMAPRELLALKLPDEPDPAGEDALDEEAVKETPSIDDLKPFERGPEISEVR